MKKAIRTLTVALCCLILISTAAAPAFAADFDPYAKNSLEIIFQEDKDTLIPGADFHIYRVGAVDEDGKIYAVDPFGYYPVLITEVDNVSGNLGAALSLKGFVLSEDISPDASAKTDSKGRCKFNDLDSGIYLVYSDPCEYDGRIFTSKAILIRLPAKTVDGGWTNDVQIIPKYDVREKTGVGIERKVLKDWENEDMLHTSRPSYVTVLLLKDGEVYDEVRLSGLNRWRYTWSDLDETSDWTVAEVPAPYAYTVSVTQEGETFVITNTMRDETTPVIPVVPIIPIVPVVPIIPVIPFIPITGEIPEIPDIPDIPSLPIKPVDPVPGTTPQSPGDSQETDKTDSADSGRLPQTGQLWWPLPVMIAAGLILLVYGIDQKRKERENEA